MMIILLMDFLIQNFYSHITKFTYGMFLGPAARSEFSHKRHKIHMNAILGEMKAKNNIHYVQPEEHISQQNHPSLSTVKKISKQNVSVGEEVSKKSMESIQSRKQRKYRSSRISIKLEEIVKYAQMFPSERERRSTKLRKTEDFKNLVERQKIKASGFKNRRGGIFVQKKQINKDLLLNFQINSQQLNPIVRKEEHENYHKMRIKKLIEDHKQKHKSTNDFSMRHFIEEEIQDLANSNKNQRVTLPSKGNKKNLSLCSFDEKKPIDVRNENIHKIYRFIRGGQPIESEEYSDYVNMDEMERNRKNFKIYDKIHAKIKNNLYCQKINAKNLYEQTVKNVIYLSEAITQETNIERKSEVKKAIKRLKINL